MRHQHCGCISMPSTFSDCIWYHGMHCKEVQGVLQVHASGHAAKPAAPALSAPRQASQAPHRSAAAKSAGIDDMFRSSRPANLGRPVHIQIAAPAFFCAVPCVLLHLLY